MRISRSTTTKLTFNDLSLEFVNFLSTLNNSLELGLLELDSRFLLFGSHFSLMYSKGYKVGRFIIAFFFPNDLPKLEKSITVTLFPTFCHVNRGGLC